MARVRHGTAMSRFGMGKGDQVGMEPKVGMPTSMTSTARMEPSWQGKGEPSWQGKGEPSW